MIFFEDLAVGARFDLGGHQLAPDEITAFARAYDPVGLAPIAECPPAARRPGVPARAAAAAAAADRPAASGWLIACLWMRSWVAFVERADAEARAAGRPVAALGPSPGIERLEWPARASAGDTLVFASEVRALRVSQSRPRWGLMTLANSAHVAAGEGRGPCVLSFASSAFVARREPPRGPGAR